MDKNYELMLPLHFATASRGIYDNQRLVLLYQIVSTNLYNSTRIVAGIYVKKLGNCDLYARAQTAT